MKNLIVIFFLCTFLTTIVGQNVLVQQGVYRLHSHIDTNYVYPEWYGANPYDTASDRAAIQSAIEAAHLKNKDVWLGKGSYKLSSFGYDSATGYKFGLRLRGNVRLVGHGPQSRIYSTVNSDSFAIVSVKDSSSGVLIQDIHIASDSCNKGMGILIRPGCDKVQIHRVSISGVIPIGVKAMNSTNGDISKCNISVTGSSLEYAGIKLQSCSGWSVESNAVSSDASRTLTKTRFGGGIWVQYDTSTTRPKSNKILHNSISNTTCSGIMIQGDSASLYCNNLICNVDGVGIYFYTPSAVSKQISKQINIVGNALKNCFYSAASYTQKCCGIYANGSYHIQIATNTIDSIIGYDTTMVDESNIKLDYCRFVNITGNTLSNSYYNGVSTQDGSNVTIAHNIIYGTGYASHETGIGIFADTNETLISGNTITDTGLPVIRMVYSIFVMATKTFTTGNTLGGGIYFDGGTATEANNHTW